MTTRDSSHDSEVKGPDLAGSSAEFGGRAIDESLPHSSFPRVRFGRKAFLALNAFLVFHLFAIVICPASVEPSSPLVQAGFQLVSPYLHMLYLDHGFHFFAPDPGESTLLSYSLEFPDGTTTTGRIPNREIFPRLYYHRHFMLTEFLGNGPEELLPFVERSFARNLCRQTGATRVSLTKVVHDTASVADIRRGLSLNDSSLFTETPLGNYTAEELRLPFKPALNASPMDTEEMSSSSDEKKDIP